MNDVVLVCWTWIILSIRNCLLTWYRTVHQLSTRPGFIFTKISDSKLVNHKNQSLSLFTVKLVEIWKFGQFICHIMRISSSIGWLERSKELITPWGTKEWLGHPNPHMDTLVFSRTQCQVKTSPRIRWSIKRMFKKSQIRSRKSKTRFSSENDSDANAPSLNWKWMEQVMLISKLNLTV